ncbi:MAG: non-lysosomal glucosylceramidase [Chitinophagaceae bacterium]|nr:non-lysosomal glucosylceramidase [Chitinophagaceae bacterium]
MKKDNRRSFLKKVTVSSFGVSVMPGTLLAQKPEQNQVSFYAGNGEKPASSHKYNSSYTGENLNKIGFPIGGIGAGMFCIEGTGAFSHMSVRNKPEIFNEPGMFAAICVKGVNKGARVLEGPVPDWKKFGRPGSGNGSAGSIYGLPRFHRAEFVTRFPFSTIRLEDNDLPLKVQITAWSPFIPTDEDRSSLPAGAIEYAIKNTGSTSLDMVFSFNSRNFMQQSHQKGTIKKIDNGYILSQDGPDEKPFLRGDFAIFTDNDDTVVDHCWFRGGWWDPLTMAWNNIKDGNIRQVDPVESDAPGASLFVPVSLKPGGEKSIRVMMTWYVPESDMHIGKDGDETGEACDPASGCCFTTADLGMNSGKSENPSPNYKPWYSSRFKDVEEVAAYWKQDYQDLYNHSRLFTDAFYAGTLPPEVTEAIAANLTIIKSPTVLRQYDGRLWTFEGCGDNSGCCHGSCTHVWNYAQSIPHLFPALERSLRHTEFCESQNKEGHQMFRSNLPIRPVKHDFYAAADGQLGGIMKVYREWRIYGDNDWLKKMFPLVKKSLDYCIATWDPRHKGILEEPHHNTYDIEFWGPDGMCTSFYLGALTAIIKMGKFLKKDVAPYETLYTKGKKYMETELFNGEYFIQQISYKNLNAADPVRESQHSLSISGSYSPEALQLLQKEGPKYQYGTGCLSDGVLGAWIALVCGLDAPVDAEKTKRHLRAIHRYNLKTDLSEHANPQRPAYALGEEGGLLLCTWPKGGKLSLPFVYSDEVWTGIEYQVASHLIMSGQVEEGLEIVRICRDRYDGKIRNPFNEYECGHWYARAMSSYGLLQALTGVRFDAVEDTLYIDSKIGDFTGFLCTATGFGIVGLINGAPFLETSYGKIAPKKIIVSGKNRSLVSPPTSRNNSYDAEKRY